MGVVSVDQAEAIFVYAKVASMTEAVPAPVRFAGLDPDASYRITRLPLPGRDRDNSMAPPPWLASEGFVARGGLLMDPGLQPPLLEPESAMIIHLSSR